ncbi:MAG: VF530 family DNA-binding protein, partial [Leucothrix sp.]
LNINCFKTNPSVAASAKFFKKTDWAREKVEIFYLYEYKSLPPVSSEQFKLVPRERIIPEGVTPKEPKVLSLEDAERRNQKRIKKTVQRNSQTGERKGSSKAYNERRKRSHASSDQRPSKPSRSTVANPWGNFQGPSE